MLFRSRSNQSILKEISPECSLEGMMLKLKLQYFGHLMRRVDSLEKTLLLEMLLAGHPLLPPCNESPHSGEPLSGVSLQPDAFEMWYWRRLLRVPWTARRSNQSILKEISPECSLEGMMLKLKL